MAKGRKLTSSRSERYLGNYGQGTANAAGSELGEEDIWSVVEDGSVNGDDDDDHSGYAGDWRESYGSHRSRRPTPSSGGSHVGGLSLAFDVGSSNASSQRNIVHQFRPQENGAVESPRGRHVAASAPVNVPDWSRIYRVDSVESIHDSDDGFVNDESELVPPHEYVARSRKMAANSVFVGVGRTLKGRDMSRVRDAVWSQTGFDG